MEFSYFWTQNISRLQPREYEMGRPGHVEAMHHKHIYAHFPPFCLFLRNGPWKCRCDKERRKKKKKEEEISYLWASLCRRRKRLDRVYCNSNVDSVAETDILWPRVELRLSNWSSRLGGCDITVSVYRPGRGCYYTSYVRRPCGAGIDWWTYKNIYVIINMNKDEKKSFSLPTHFIR